MHLVDAVIHSDSAFKVHFIGMCDPLGSNPWTANTALSGRISKLVQFKNVHLLTIYISKNVQ